MPTLLQLRRGLASAWIAANPVLHAGEPAVDLDTLTLKIGDGLTRWGDLVALGAAGPAGVTGPQGPIGPTGLTGAPGAIGLTGPQGPIGVTGTLGPQGPIGVTGPDGPAGAQGPIGLTGADGATGPTGAVGPTGLTGATGAAGSIGPTGATGPTGPAGPSIWGGITGTLSAQLDLQAALDAKVPITRTVNGHVLSADVVVSKADVGLGSVENTALSTWAGSANLTTLGAVTNITPGATFTLTQNTVTPFVSVASGAITNTLVLSAGQIGVNTATLSTLAVTIDGGLRVRLPGSTRYRGDFNVPNASGGNLNAFDDTAGVWLPLNIDGNPLRLNPASGKGVSVGNFTPTAAFHLKAGTIVAGSAPLKFTSGPLLTAAEAGAIEFLTDAFFATITTGAARKTFAFLESPSFTGTAAALTAAPATSTTQLATTEFVTLAVAGVSGGAAAAGSLTGATIAAGVTASSLTSFGTSPALTTPTVTTSITVTRSALAVTPADGVIIQNATAATAAIPIQEAPDLRIRSSVWNSTSVAAVADEWFVRSIPVNGAVPTGLLKIGHTLSANAFQLTSGGTLTLAGGLTTGSAITLTASTLRFAGVRIDGNTASQLLLLNTAQSVGVGLDFATDAIVKVRTRAQTGYASVDALGYAVSGVAGASKAAGPVTSITVVNGIVTACT